MKRIIITGLFVTALLFLNACASSHRYSVLEPSKKELASFRILEIRDFKSNLFDSESKELASRFADRLHQNILKDRQEYPDEVIFDDVVRQTNETEGVLLLDGTVVSFEKGSRAARYLIGFGAGKAYCTIQSVFTDKTTKEPVLKLSFDGELSMGFFGGSSDEAVQAVVEAYLDYFDDYFENQGANPTIKLTDHSTETLKEASIPKDVSIVRVSLRKKPLRRADEERINNMLIKYGFFDTSRNVLGDFENHFVNNNDGTITDKATGLMWQKNGSTKLLNNSSAKGFVKKLNRRRFAGHSDWRMPTLEELASLLERSSKSGVHIDPVFDHKQSICWTVDKFDATDPRDLRTWIVDFKRGQILQATDRKVVIIHYGDPYAKKYLNYAKAVRSVK